MNPLAQASRRELLQMACGLGFASTSGWFGGFAAAAAEQVVSGKRVILLWLYGGPATIDLWDLKPGHENGGPFREIETTAPGLRISEYLPKLARQANDLAVIRSLSSSEGDHDRATQFVKTGYKPLNAIQFPTLGALVSREIARREIDLPGYVSILPGDNSRFLGGGFLGPQFSPLTIGERGAGPDDLKVPNISPSGDLSPKEFNDRLSLLHSQEHRYAARRRGDVVDSLKSAADQAIRLMQKEAAQAFDLDAEDESVRAAYGRSSFGQGCLLARRLVERGVSFVEVTLDGWDTHNNNFDRVKTLSATLDSSFAALLDDLRNRGLLDSTLILCLGEFGRTPKINATAGRDHWPQSWAAVMAGGGIRGGQVVGSTSADGMAVKDRALTVPDLISTVCRAISIDPKKQNMSNVTRPIRIADPAAMPIEELL